MTEFCTELTGRGDLCVGRAVWVRARSSDGFLERFCGRHARDRGLVGRDGSGLHGAVRLEDFAPDAEGVRS
jgi:hypothetical protein